MNFIFNFASSILTIVLDDFIAHVLCLGHTKNVRPKDRDDFLQETMPKLSFKQHVGHESGKALTPVNISVQD